MIRFYVAVFHAECSMITENDLELCTEGQPVSTVFALKNAEQEKERIRRAGQKVDEENNCWKCVPLNRMDGSKPGDDTTAKIVKTIDAGDGKPPIEMVDISKNPDVGFRVFKLDDTNMKDVYYSAEEYSQTNLEDLESNIKEDRTDLDLLFGCLLDWGLPLSMPYRSEKIDNCTVHTYAPGDAALNVPDALIACFDSQTQAAPCSVPGFFLCQQPGKDQRV